MMTSSSGDKLPIDLRRTSVAIASMHQSLKCSFRPTLSACIRVCRYDKSHLVIGQQMEWGITSKSPCGHASLSWPPGRYGAVVQASKWLQKWPLGDPATLLQLLPSLPPPQRRIRDEAGARAFGFSLPPVVTPESHSSWTFAL